MLYFSVLAVISAFYAPAPAPVQQFDPIRFFEGRTEGVGKLKIVLRKAHDVRFRGHGAIQLDGSIIFDQVVEREGERTERHRWHMRAGAGNRYTGTVSTARGPISAERNGDVFRMRYVDKDGFAIDQSFTAHGDGRTATIRLKAKKMGMTVATMQQTVRKLD